MKFICKLLTSDAVGGLGPPADLIKNKPEMWQIILVILGIYLLFSSPLIIRAIVKRIRSKKNTKGDK